MSFIFYLPPFFLHDHSDGLFATIFYLIYYLTILIFIMLYLHFMWLELGNHIMYTDFWIAMQCDAAIDISCSWSKQLA